MKILVTGGAGYIGSAAVKELIKNKHQVIVVDNLSTGLRKLVDKKAEFYKIDIINKKQLETIFKKKIDAVMHFAAYKSVEESQKNKKKYLQNITGTKNILELMVKYNVKKIIFSSSATVYGSPKYVPMDEKHPTKPINYYGETKLECEKLIEKYSKKHNLNYVIFRYFNVAGDCGLGYIDPNPKNIFPVLMNLINENKTFTIFGDKYKTPDGTCIRDYIHVNDIVSAHILALKINSSNILNLGTSKGISVKVLLEAFEKNLNITIPKKIGKKRWGDPKILIASNKKALRILNWKPKNSVDDMILSTVGAYNQ